MLAIMPRHAGRVVSYEDRQRARALIEKVDAKIRAGLLQIEPEPPKRWFKDYGITLTKAADPRPAVPRQRIRRREAELFT